MKELIRIDYINDQPIVVGRILHAALEIKTDYSTWFKRMCEYGFEEGVDYIQFLEKEEPVNTVLNSNPNPKTNHQLTLDTAKEIAMIQRTPLGRTFRKYFIEVEKKYRQQIKSTVEIPQSQNPRNCALIDAGQQAVILNQYFGVDLGIARAHTLNEVEKEFGVNLSDIKKLLPAAESHPVDYNPTQLAEKLSKTYGVLVNAQQVNCYLRELNLQYKSNKTWYLTDAGKEYGVTYPYERNGHSGFQIRWKAAVEKLIEKHYFR